MTAVRDLPFPADDVLLTLAVIARVSELGGTFDYDPDADYFGATWGGKCFRIEFAQFDALQERGWIAVGDEAVTATEQGKWQAARFLKRRKLTLTF
jgi:hypothetical protein